jgi:hypothetical protein
MVPSTGKTEILVTQVISGVGIAAANTPLFQGTITNILAVILKIPARNIVIVSFAPASRRSLLNLNDKEIDTAIETVGNSQSGVTSLDSTEVSRYIHNVLDNDNNGLGLGLGINPTAVIGGVSVVYTCIVPSVFVATKELASAITTGALTSSLQVAYNYFMYIYIYTYTDGNICYVTYIHIYIIIKDGIFIFNYQYRTLGCRIY